MNANAASLFQELAKNSERSEMAKFRDIYDDVEMAIKAGASLKDILNLIQKLGIKMELPSFKSALHRVRKERGLSKSRNKKGGLTPATALVSIPAPIQTSANKNEDEPQYATEKERRKAESKSIADYFVPIAAGSNISKYL